MTQHYLENLFQAITLSLKELGVSNYKTLAMDTGYTKMLKTTFNSVSLWKAPFVQHNSVEVASHLTNKKKSFSVSFSEIPPIWGSSGGWGDAGMKLPEEGVVNYHDTLQEVHDEALAEIARRGGIDLAQLTQLVDEKLKAAETNESVLKIQYDVF
jgi:hypothetical protein